jgi:hypothetical protein
MNAAANCGDDRGIAGSRTARWFLLLLIFAGLFYALEVCAEDVGSASSQLAEQSFALLDRLSKQRGDKSNPLVGPIASFAGDADSLRQSLARSDLLSARSSIASLQADSTAIDQALMQHPDAIPAEEWRGLRQQYYKLAREIPPCTADCGAVASGSASGLPPGTTADGDAPRIVIASRESSGGIIRLRGYFEGRALRSAGIYKGFSELKAFKVDEVPGRQRVKFDLRLDTPSPMATLRVADAAGRSAEVPVLDRSLPPMSSSATAESADSVPSMAPIDSSRLPAELGEDSGTAEIPSHGPLLPSPSKRHTLGSRLGDVKINVLSVTQVGKLPPTYEIAGQIIGRGISRAGIYVNGRLNRAIPVIRSANYTSFDQRFVARGGSTTIRAYSLAGQFSEQPVDLSETANSSELSDYLGDGAVITTPMATAQIAIQITSVRALPGGICVVSGIISGPDLASAGLYQNGVLAQNINATGGLSSALSALLPGNSRSINFSARFNPYAGPASIRAFDSTGAFTEQPVMIAGIAPYGPSRPNALYGGTANFPYGRGLPTSRYPNGLGRTRPLW